MPDLIERLHYLSLPDQYGRHAIYASLCGEAAVEIRNLKVKLEIAQTILAELQRIRGQLERLEEHVKKCTNS